MKYAWVNFTTSNVTNKLIGMRLLKRMMKVKKLSPKLLAPPSVGKTLFTVLYFIYIDKNLA
jgi:hypothetical protein